MHAQDRVRAAVDVMNVAPLGASAPVVSSASGTDVGNVDGEAVAITVFSKVKWWGRIELPLFFLYVRFRSGSLGDLRKLSFIHAAHWSLVRRLPGNGGEPTRRLRHPLLYFESNFNGGWEEYIDAFSYVLHRGMWAFWGSSYGYPQALPPSPFKDYIRQNQYEACHFYSAYPEATATTVLAALKFAPRVNDLRQKAPTMTAEEFARAWQDLLSRSQADTPNKNPAGGMQTLTVITPVIAERLPTLRAILADLRRSKPLARLAATHFARFVIVPNRGEGDQPRVESLPSPYLLFSATFDGSDDDYLDDLCQKLDAEGQAIWGCCLGAPQPARGTELKVYLQHNQIRMGPLSGLFFSAYPDADVARVKAALSVRAQTIALAIRGQAMDVDELRLAFLEGFPG